jgi:hypothetical protein
MMRRMAAMIAALLTVPVGSAAAVAPSQADSVANLRAFARLYGYVRFFHPSDEASSIDWNRFAVLGAGRVVGCADAKGLRTALIGLFSPLAPSVQVYGAGTQPRPVKLPGDSVACLPVCWQHYGVGLSEPSIYRSERTNRPKSFGRASRSVFQPVVLPIRDSAASARVRVRALARSEGVKPGDDPLLFVVGYDPRVDPETSMMRASVAAVSGKAWHESQVEVSIEPGQSQAAVGVVNGVSSRLWVDDFEAWVSSGDTWVKLELADAGFEDSVSLEESPVWMYAAGAEKSGEGSSAGGKCLFVKPSAGPGAFPGSPLPAEYVDKPLERGLSCRVPLSLWSRDGHTLPRADGSAFKRLESEINAMASDTVSDPPLEMRLGDVVIAWAIAQHFYPYFDVVPVDWDTVLTATLFGSLHTQGRSDFLKTFRQMSAALCDGHGWVDDSRVGRAFVPARLEVVEGRVVVTAATGSAGLRSGDVVLAVNDRPVAEALEEEIRLSSGSPHFRLARGVRRLSEGTKNDTVHYLVERGADTISVSAEVSGTGVPSMGPDVGDSIRQLAKGIWYVDLIRAPMPAIDAVMDKLVEAKGVVFDLRGYPSVDNHEVFCHLLTGRELRGEKWMWIPQIAYPDHENTLGWNGFGWEWLQPKEPHIAGRVVFLTDASAVSGAESYMSYVEGYKLAEIVGSPTAGTNGNINPVDLPGGFTFSWTGMKVTRFDGSQHHLIGIRPTVPLERTLKAVREGRDEYIERALALIRGV